MGRYAGAGRRRATAGCACSPARNATSPSPFPSCAALADEYADMLLDGEIVAMRDGVPSFAALAERFHVTDAPPGRRCSPRPRPVTLMTFDLLRLYGVDLMSRALDRPARDARAARARRSRAGRCRRPSPTGRCCTPRRRSRGSRASSASASTRAYLPGLRSPHWLKSPHRGTVSVVIGGWRPESTGTVVDRLGAVLVGVPGPGGPALPRAGRSRARRQGGAARSCADLGRLAPPSPLRHRRPARGRRRRRPGSTRSSSPTCSRWD